MGIISVEQTNRLYWLGRYAERVYTLVRCYFKSYDTMIDEIRESYHDFCQMIDIPDIYKDKQDFMKSYPFDENNPDSIISNLIRAYDNAIVLRESIGSESLSYIQLAIYEMNKAKLSDAPLIELQFVIDNILAFWGMIDDKLDDDHVRNIIKSGKRIERFDLYARLGLGREVLVREANRMIPRIEKSGMDIKKDSPSNAKQAALMTQDTMHDMRALLQKGSQGFGLHITPEELVESILGLLDMAACSESNKPKMDQLRLRLREDLIEYFTLMEASKEQDR